jgi:4-hydroxybenzoate polyprenyltransferase
MSRASWAGRGVALLRASHPAPTVGVTGYATTLAAAAGNGPGTCALLAAAVLTGQLSIGWSNDRLDLPADRAVGRDDKPLATGVLPVRLVDGGIAVAVAATIVLSLALGYRAGLVHLAAVSCGWIYNRWLKGTWFSAVPYAAAFGGLPAVATLALPAHAWPAWWAVTAAAMLGVAANLTNALPDLERDRQTGFRGLPSRIGARPSVASALMLLLGAVATLGFGPVGPPGVVGWAGMAVTAALVLGFAPVAWRTSRSRVPFYALMLVVPVFLAMIVTNGNRLR